MAETLRRNDTAVQLDRAFAHVFEAETALKNTVPSPKRLRILAARLQEAATLLREAAHTLEGS